MRYLQPSNLQLVRCVPLAVAAAAASPPVGSVPFPHAMMRQVNSLVASLPALDNPQFKT